MNERMSTVNIFPFFRLRKKTRRWLVGVYFAAREKNECCAEYTPLLITQIMLILFRFKNYTQREKSLNPQNYTAFTQQVWIF